VDVRFQLSPVPTVNVHLFILWAPVNLHAPLLIFLHHFELAPLVTVCGVMSKFSLTSLGITLGTYYGWPKCLPDLAALPNFAKVPNENGTKERGKYSRHK